MDLVQQILDLDSDYAVYRSRQGVSNTLYMRRRAQLLREQVAENSAIRRKYINYREQLLQNKYGYTQCAPKKSKIPLGARRSEEQRTPKIRHNRGRSTSILHNGAPRLPSLAPPEPCPRSKSGTNSPTFSSRYPTPPPASTSMVMKSHGEIGSSQSYSDYSKLVGKGADPSTNHHNHNNSGSQKSKNRAKVTMADHYTFDGVHCLFDHSKVAVLCMRFARGTTDLLAFGGLDGYLSVCSVGGKPSVLHMFDDHAGAITDIVWMANNENIITSSVDCTIRIWNLQKDQCIKILKTKTALLCLTLCPINNNFALVGTGSGHVQCCNLSVGKWTKGGYTSSSAPIKCLVFDRSGSILWSGDSQGSVLSYSFDPQNGTVRPLIKVIISKGSPVTSIAYCASRHKGKAESESLLVNCRNNILFVLAVHDDKGTLRQKKTLNIKQKNLDIRSTFSPKTPRCIVSGSEDGLVYLYDGSSRNKSESIIAKLEGHCSGVLCVCWNSSENFLASSDTSGKVIIWKRRER